MIQFKNHFNEFNQLTGDLLETERHLLFFGSKHADLKYLDRMFAASPVLVKQVHGDLLVEADREREFEADALYTTEVHLPIAVKTADCMPIAILAQDYCMMIHAGWRGLANNIIGKSLQGFLSNEATAYIGPHIHFSSFEIKEDAGVLLVGAFKDVEKHDIMKEPLISRHLEEGKSLFNLMKLARAQLAAAGINHTRIYSSPVDTFSNKIYNSYRRDKDKAGRNLSFCLLK